MAAFSRAGVEQEVRQRLIPEHEPEYDSNLPYGGKVYLARKKKPDSWYIVIAEVSKLRSTR